MLENLNKSEHIPVSREPENFQMRVVETSSSSEASSPMSLKLFPPTPLKKQSNHNHNHKSQSQKRDVEQSQNPFSTNIQMEKSEYKSVLQDTLDQLALQEKILEQQERIKRNQRMISESKGMQTDLAEFQSKREPEPESGIVDPGLTPAQVENIVKVKLKEELRKRQKHRPIMHSRVTAKPPVRPSRTMNEPAFPVVDEKKYRYDNDSSSMVTSLADLLDDLDIPNSETVKDRLFLSKGTSQQRHKSSWRYENENVDMYESRGTSIDEALERVIKQLNVL